MRKARVDLFWVKLPLRSFGISMDFLAHEHAARWAYGRELAGRSKLRLYYLIALWHWQLQAAPRSMRTCIKRGYIRFLAAPSSEYLALEFIVLQFGESGALHTHGTAAFALLPAGVSAFFANTGTHWETQKSKSKVIEQFFMYRPSLSSCLPSSTVCSFAKAFQEILWAQFRKTVRFGALKTVNLRHFYELSLSA